MTTETKERKRRSPNDTKLLFEKVTGLPLKEKIDFAKDLKENINSDIRGLQEKASEATEAVELAKQSVNGL